MSNRKTNLEKLQKMDAHDFAEAVQTLQFHPLYPFIDFEAYLNASVSLEACAKKQYPSAVYSEQNTPCLRLAETSVFGSPYYQVYDLQRHCVLKAPAEYVTLTKEKKGIELC